MKLLVNSTPLIPPLSGIGRYTQQLMIQLLRDECIEDIDGFVPFAFYSRDTLLEMVAALDYQEKHHSDEKVVNRSSLARWKSLAKKIPGARALKSRIQQLVVESKFKQFEDRIYWESNYVLAPFDGKKVATVYDLSHMRFPDFHPADRLRWLDKHLPNTIENADALVAISEFSKQELMSVFSVPKEKISIVYPAVSSNFRQTFTSEQIARFKKEYKLPEQFVLSVGTLEPRKNIKGLIQAYAELPKALRQAFPLVFAGGKGWHMEEIEAALAPMLKNKEVIILGYVPQQDMPILYSAATIFAYVSLYEGYGMPIAEAMCSGTAVITSNTTSMPEVAANCCELVDPSNGDEIAQKLRELMEDAVLREQMEIKAKAASDAYHWENSARQLRGVFESVA